MALILYCPKKRIRHAFLRRSCPMMLMARLSSFFRFKMSDPERQARGAVRFQRSARQMRRSPSAGLRCSACDDASASLRRALFAQLQARGEARGACYSASYARRRDTPQREAGGRCLIPERRDASPRPGDATGLRAPCPAQRSIARAAMLRARGSEAMPRLSASWLFHLRVYFCSLLPKRFAC